MPITKLNLILLVILIFTSCSYVDEKNIGDDDSKSMEQVETLSDIDVQNSNVTAGFSIEYENIRCLNDEEFDYIKEVYEKIEFSHEFKKGNTEDYNYYLEQYKKLLEEEVGFLDPKLQEEFYISKFGELSHDYDKGKYLYYFFDMNGDDSPELCISDGTRFVYIFSYEPISEKIILWENLNTTYVKLLGSLKVYYMRPGAIDLKNEFIQLNCDGIQECSVMFFEKGFVSKENETAYMVSFPEGETEDAKHSFLKENKDIAYLGVNNDIPFFRVTKEQYNELTDDYFESIKLSRESIKEVTFTYEELFGGYDLSEIK